MFWLWAFVWRDWSSHLFEYYARWIVWWTRFGQKKGFIGCWGVSALLDFDKSDLYIQVLSSYYHNVSEYTLISIYQPPSNFQYRYHRHLPSKLLSPKNFSLSRPILIDCWFSIIYKILLLIIKELCSSSPRPMLKWLMWPPFATKSITNISKLLVIGIRLWIGGMVLRMMLVKCCRLIRFFRMHRMGPLPKKRILRSFSLIRLSFKLLKLSFQEVHIHVIT